MSQSLNNLARDFDNCLQNRPSFGDLSNVAHVFREVVTRGLYLDAMHDMLRRNLEEQYEITPDISSGPFLVLYGSQKSSWAILRHTGRTQQIYYSPTHTISAKVAGGTLQMSRYVPESPFALDRFDTSIRLRKTETRPDVEGELLLKDGVGEAIDFQGSGVSPAFTLRVNTIPFGDYEWAFDRAGLAAVAMSGIHQAESNLTTIFELLAAVGSSNSIEHVDRFVDHRMHFVRWKAAQTINAIDNAAGALAVRRLTADPHPEVRLAARRTLEAAA